MRRSTLLRSIVVAALAAGIVYAVWAAVKHAQTPYYITVEEALAGDAGSVSRVRVGGWLDPDSVNMMPDGVHFELLATESADAARLPVRLDLPGMRADPTQDMWFVRECVLSGRMVDGRLEAQDVALRQGGGYEDALRPFDFNTLTLEPKEDQLSRLFGREITLKHADEWLGLSTYPSSTIDIYYDDRGTAWIWNMPLSVWTGSLQGSRERCVPRHQGEVSFDECLERADVLAKEYYLGDKDTFFDLRATWTRHDNKNTFPDGREVDIVSYDVMYQRYMQGIRMPDAIAVTVYALSGGSDFVGARLSDEVTWTVQPRVTPIKADEAVQRAAGTGRLRDALGQRVPLTSEEQVTLPVDADLTGFELLVWGDVLHWRMEYDWDSESLPGDADIMCDHTGATYCVDASTGEVIPMPIREDIME